MYIMSMACLAVELIFLCILQLAHSSSSSSSSSPSASSVCIPEHRNGLLEFKRYAVEDDPSGHWLSSWTLTTNTSSSSTTTNTTTTNDNCCEWKGVECDTNGHVIGLSLNNCGGIDPTDQAILVRAQQTALHGSLTPDALLALSASNISKTLSKLDLGCQLFHGSIPPEIGSLVSLSHLDLSFQAQASPHTYGTHSNRVLTGPIPDELWSLPRLSYLDLGYNSITGTISPLVGNCTTLTNLHLGTNNLTGEVPSSLGHLALLETLDISSNAGLNSLPPPDWIPSFVHLRLLDISLCDFSGPFPPWLRHLTNLSVFTLTGNQFDGEIPDWAWRLAKLTLDFSDNSFNNTLSCDTTTTGPQPFPSLTTLDVSYNTYITGTIPCFVANLTSLLTLSFAMNSLYGPIPDMFAALTKLRFLDLSLNQFDGILPSSMQHLRSLSELDLDTNLLSPQEVPSFLLDLPSIVRIDLSFNNFTAIPNDLAVRNSSLEYLKLSSNKLSGPIPSAFFTFIPNLKFLRLDSNQLSGEVPASLSQLNQLQTLDLSYNSLHGPLPSTLSNLSSLLILNVQGNPIGGPIPSFISLLDQLLVLDLGSCELNGSIPSSMGLSLPQLQVLILSYNRLTGPIPSSLGELKGMINPNAGSSAKDVIDHEDYIKDDLSITLKGENGTYSSLQLLTDLDLSNNLLIGHIPPELGALVQLLSLDLSKNRLDGVIPSALGGLVKLEALDVSQNELEGEIPQSFTQLTSLAFVNVSSNHLKGSIPTTPQWIQTFDSSSFQDNDGLCTDIISSLAKLPLCTDATPPSPGYSLHDSKERGIDNVIEWLGFAVGYVVGLLVGILCIVAHLIHKHGNLKHLIARLHIWILHLQSRLRSKQSDNDDDAIGSDDDPRNAVLEEGASNQDWQAIIARIQEELSISNFGHGPMEVDLNLNAR